MEPFCDQIAAVQKLHADLGLNAESIQDLFRLPPRLLAYLLAILHRQPIPALPASDEEWRAFMDALSPHGILPLLYHRLSPNSPEFRPPQEWWTEMRTLARNAVLSQLIMERQLTEVMRVFRQAGLTVLVLKGAAFSYWLYPDPSLRPASDVDFLVHPRDYKRTRDLLQGLGYRCSASKFEKLGFYHFHDVFLPQDPNSAYPIELHWELSRFAFFKSADELEKKMRRKIEVVNDKLEFSALSPLDAIMHAAKHLTLAHAQELRLIWINDIFLMAGRLAGIDHWHELIATAAKQEGILPLQYSLRLAQVWMGLDLPATIADFTTWPQASSRERMTWKHNLKRQQSTLSSFFLYWPRDISCRKNIQYLWRLLFPAPEIIAESYPPAHPRLLAFSYVRRLLKWLLKVRK